jgi:nitroreductase
MDVEKAIRGRRTHKAYGPRELERAELEDLFELARWAPNHHLTNPWRFRVLGPETRRALMELAEGEKPGAAAKLARAPTLVCMSALLTGEDPSQDHEDLLATAVAAYIVLLGASARGLASYWRTVGLLDGAPARELLSLGEHERVLGLLYLGDPVQEQRVPARAPLEDLVSYLS